MSSPRFRFTPSILQSWSDYVNSDRLWEKFYGSKEDPSVTMEEFQEKKERELWDAINRIDRGPIEAADRGTCLNEIIDMIIEGRPVEKPGMETARLTWEDGSFAGVRAMMNGFVFDFGADLVLRLSEYFAGSTCQYRTEAVLETSLGPVILYGDIDYINRDKVFDMKSTEKYEYGKYSEGWQKYLYPYCLIESGEMTRVSEFEYTVAELRRKNNLISGDIYRERYDYSHEMAKVRLRGVCESFMAYLDMHRDSIEHKRILNQ